MPNERGDNNQLLILAPDGRDASVLRAVLAEAGISAEIDPTGEQLVQALRSGTHGGAVMTDEGLTRLGMSTLRDAVDEQPTWSDFPVVVLARRGPGGRGDLRAVVLGCFAPGVARRLEYYLPGFISLIFWALI